MSTISWRIRRPWPWWLPRTKPLWPPCWSPEAYTLTSGVGSHLRRVFWLTSWGGDCWRQGHVNSIAPLLTSFLETRVTVSLKQELSKKEVNLHQMPHHSGHYYQQNIPKNLVLEVWINNKYKIFCFPLYPVQGLVNLIFAVKMSIQEKNLEEQKKI